MKVLHFIWSANFGGIEKLVITLARQQLQNKNLQPALLIGKRTGNFLELIEKNGIPYEFAGLKTGLDISFQKFNKIRKLMSSFDIIHIHTFNPLVAFAAVKTGKKIVFTVHGNFGFGRKRGFNDRILQYLCGLFMRKYVNYITYNSEFSRNYAMKFYHLKPFKNETLIYNAIPENAFLNLPASEEVLKIPTNRFIIGTASRFAGFKRIDRLIEAFSVFCQNKPDTLLMLTGDGIKMQELKNLVKKKGIEQQVYFTGYLENVFASLNKMDVCVFPSENEPFGIVALEALALGKPVMVFADGGGITEIIKPLNKFNIAANEEHLVERLNFYYFNRKAVVEEKEINTRYALRFNMADTEKAMYSIYCLVMNEDEK